ncbi:MAG: hypothetical protein F4W92_04885 [Gammaproteobacteria bacterium]|nr:hypothetical protein [Gammaproteobacteria bacterium]
MKLFKIFALISLTSLISLSAISQQVEETDSTESSSESSTRLETTQRETDENEGLDATSEIIDGLVESMLEATVSMFGLTLSGDLFEEVIDDMKKNWPASIEEFDADKDGSLSLEELENVPEENWEDDFKALSAEERDETLKSQFKELDTDEDGEVTVEEVVKHLEKQVETLEELFKDLESSSSTESSEKASNSVE